ncbi:MAG: glycine--tRNA ligase [Gemmataceae bacterium]|nr:glycine--tRNA ligase [Gemmataceae bacterium]
MDKLVSLCKRRGFIFQSSEIYGGLNGFWDYGPLGVELKKNIKDAWWQDMVRNPPPGPDGEEIQMVGLDCAIIMNPKVWEASGHVGGFADPMVDCKACKSRFRADQLICIEIARDLFKDTPEGLMHFYYSGIGTAEEVQTKHKKKIDKLLQGGGGFNVVTTLPYLQVPEAARRLVFCPECEQQGHLTEPRSFNLMFQTCVGALQDAASVAYLRPETAQGIFVNFKNVLDSTRLKLPFGIAQIGKAFRNEINPRNYTFRSREFEQMEIEFFCRPEESMKWYQYWRDVRIKWYSQLGIQSERLRPREQGKDELAHYSVGTTDIEYLFPFSDEPQELEGVAHRADYDLTQHMKHSGKDLSYFEEELWAKADKSAYGGDKKKEQEAKSKPPYRFMPHVIEPSAGADRFALAVLCEAYCEDTAPDEHGKPQARVLLKLHPRLAPIKAAVLPLVNRDGMPEIAEKLYRQLKAELNVYFDDGGAVGRRYRRQDEAGTPWCITIDGQTLQDQTVTIRDRDSLEQWRVKLDAVADDLRKRLQ